MEDLDAYLQGMSEDDVSSEEHIMRRICVDAMAHRASQSQEERRTLAQRILYGSIAPKVARPVCTFVTRRRARIELDNIARLARASIARPVCPLRKKNDFTKRATIKFTEMLKGILTVPRLAKLRVVCAGRDIGELLYDDAVMHDMLRCMDSIEATWNVY